tara:strand:- start:228 stop:1523 length:1296 start_codon:yes stop_codon:yes gene_type:complete
MFNLQAVKIVSLFTSATLVLACCNNGNESKSISVKEKPSLSAKDILGNPDYLAMSYGGYRDSSRKVQPLVEELKEDMKILSAMGVKILRTYNVHLDHASNVLSAIEELKKEDLNFEMYVMLGAWIDCENAWTDHPNHYYEDVESNTVEVNRLVELAKQHPDIVKILAVGNEAMVKWAASYFVQPWVILKWVDHLQSLKETGELPSDLWITSSDNFASWGGGHHDYHNEDLIKLINAVDYISMHTYPMHDTHYNPFFWHSPRSETKFSKVKKINAAMLRAKEYASSQYDGVANYMDSLGIKKPIHIGETGWASFSDDFYGNSGSKALDEYKQALYFRHMRDWTKKAGLSCFFFEAFDEKWKDVVNIKGSENHFGLITLKGEVKFALWNLVDEAKFKGLTRNGNPIVKTYGGDKKLMMKDVLLPPSTLEMIEH